MVLNHEHPARILLAALALLLLAAAAPPLTAAPQYTLKFATLAPPGTAWMNVAEEWGREVAQRSGGRLVLKFYPGGVQGDEPDVLKKIRFGQLQGGAFSGYGIGRIHSPARVLEIPFLFHSHDEIDEVRAHFMPAFEQGFRDKGYELLGWMEVGFVHFFSKHPVRSLDDLRASRIWVWQGDPLAEAWFHAAGISPVPLSIMDVYTSLSTGLIDTIYSTPLVALALQWFTKVEYMTRVPMANGIGALVVSRQFIDRLPPDLQELLRETGKATGERLTALTRADNLEAMELLEQEGIKSVLHPDELDRAEVRRIGEQAAERFVRSTYIPRPVFDRTRELLSEIRARDRTP